MPYAQATCECNICRGKCGLISKRTARLHVEKYGRFEEQELTSSPYTSPIKQDAWPQTHYDKDQLSTSGSEYHEEGNG